MVQLSSFDDNLDLVEEFIVSWFPLSHRSLRLVRDSMLAGIVPES